MEQLDAMDTVQRARPRQGADSESSPSWRPVFCLVVFGLLLTVTLTMDALREPSTLSGSALVYAGIMLFAGVADLLDPAARRVVVGVRYGGMAMALLGLVLQLVS